MSSKKILKSLNKTPLNFRKITASIAWRRNGLELREKSRKSGGGILVVSCRDTKMLTDITIME